MTTGTSINDPGRSLRPGQKAAGEVHAGRRPEESLAPRKHQDSGAATVRDIMTRSVRCCRPGDTLAAAAVAMCEADCRFLPVVDVTGRPIGIVTDGDICLLGTTSHRRLSDMYVRDAMSASPATCHADDGVLDVLKLMRQRRIRHLPVVGRQGILEGVLCLTDVVLCAEEQDSPFLRREVARALREMVQKHGCRRVIEQDPLEEH